MMPITKSKTKDKHIDQVRAKKGKDLSPNWDGNENWSADQFSLHFRRSMEWYRMEHTGKDLKPKVINWMSVNGYTKDQIKDFKNTKDNRCGTTMGAIAANLLKGMPPVRADFNNGKNTAAWLGEAISKVTQEGANDHEDVVVESESGPIVIVQPSIQDRLREASYKMTEEIEDAIESFIINPETFDPKQFKIINLLKGKDAKAAHARIIKEIYSRQYNELTEAAEGKDEQLKEAYSHLSKAQLKKIIAFYNEIITACDMLAQEAKINRRPRAKKSVPADKIVGKLKYAKTYEPLKLVSINPTDIVGSKELWVFNTKTRKMGKYVAKDYQELTVKGTTILNYDENLSVQKTLRKPEDQLKEFKSAGKVALRKFLDEIKAVDIKLNGRINEETILLKVS